MYTLDELLNKFNAAKTRHLRWTDQAIDAFSYVTPQRDGLAEFFQYMDAGKITTAKIFSSVPQTAAVNRANKLIRMLMPDNEQWGTLTFNKDAITKANVKTALTDEDIEKAVEALYMYFQASNLAQQSQDAMVDEAVGAGALWLGSDSDDYPLVYEAIPGFSVMPEYYRGSTIRDLWYVFSVSGEFILDSYPDIDRSTRILVEGRTDGNPFWIKRGVIWDSPEGSDRKSWRYVDILDAGGDQGNYQLDSYFKEYKKLAYFRDRTRPGEVAGRGPAIDYMPEIKRLNVINKNSDEADEIRSFPPSEVDMSKYNPEMVTNFAGSMFPLNTFGKTFELPDNPAVDNKIDRLEERIRKGFAVDPIGSLDQPVRTAQEISARIDDFQANTTIDTSRLLKECSAAVFENSFSMLLERGLIPKSAEFIKLRNEVPKAILFSYINPLGEVQKNNNLLKLQRSLQLAQQYFGPQGFLAIFVMNQLQDFFAKNSGLPLPLFNKGNVVEQRLQGALNAQNQAEQQGANGQGQAQSSAPSSGAGLPTPTTAAQQVNPLQQMGYSI